MEASSKQRFLYELEVLHHNMDFENDMLGAIEALGEFCVQETIDTNQDYPDRINLCYFKLPIRERDE